MDVKVKYIGDGPLEHPSGAWKPGDERMMGGSCALALVRERGDMELVKDDPKPKAKPKPKGPKAGGEDE